MIQFSRRKFAPQPWLKLTQIHKKTFGMNIEDIRGFQNRSEKHDSF